MLAKQVYHTATPYIISRSDISFMQEFEFIRKSGKNIFFVVHRQKIQIPIRVSVFFIVLGKGFENLNAVRMSAAGEGLTEPLLYFSFC